MNYHPLHAKSQKPQEYTPGEPQKAISLDIWAGEWKIREGKTVIAEGRLEYDDRDRAVNLDTVIEQARQEAKAKKMQFFASEAYSVFLSEDYR